MLRKSLITVLFVLFAYLSGSAQIEIAHVSVKNFRATGFGLFLNFAQPVSEASSVTLEGGLQYFVNRFSEDLGLIPVVVGYRYTFNRMGTGLYVEPSAGYNLGSSTIERFPTQRFPTPETRGRQSYEKVSGAVAGFGLGYLFQPIGMFQFNAGIHFKHTFASAASDVISLRIAHSVTFGR